MRQYFRGTTVAAVIAALALVTVGMSTGASPAAASSSGSSVHLVLTMWGSTGDQTTYQQRANLYTKSHHNVTVTVKNIPTAQYSQEVETMIAGGSEPDIMETSPGQNTAIAYAADGELVNLNSYIKGMNLDAMYTPAALVSAFVYKGEQYALPDRGGHALLYYNKTMFDKAGLALPKAGWTWAQFLQDAQKLTIVQNGKTVQWGASVDNWEQAVDSVTHSFGGDQVNASLTKGTLNSPAYKLGLTMYNALAWKWHVSPTLEDYANYGANVNRDALFAEGKTAMIWAGAWDIPTDVQDHIDFGLAAPPVGVPGDANVMGFGTGLAVGVHGVNPQVAVDVVKFMTSPAGQVPIVTNHEDWPSSTADLPLYLKSLPKGYDYAGFNVPTSMIFEPRVPVQWVEMQSLIQQDLYPFFAGKETVTQATGTANAAVDQLLSSSS